MIPVTFYLFVYKKSDDADLPAQHWYIDVQQEICGKIPRISLGRGSSISKSHQNHPVRNSSDGDFQTSRDE